MGFVYGLVDPKWNIASLCALRILVSKATASSVVNAIDLSTPISDNFTCVKTKRLLDVVRTTLCIHDSTDHISAAVVRDKIWEEVNLGILFRVLFRYPDLAFVDVGANIGTFTMFAAELGRPVMAIECFQPNYQRIAKALQLENVTEKVSLIGNAIFSRSNQTLRLNSVPSNIGGQGVEFQNSVNQSLGGPYTVTTIRFDDVLPILQQRKFRSVIMKVDIEGSEHYLCSGGSEVFDYLDVVVILMEWANIKLVQEHALTVLEFFTKRQYIATTDTCHEIKIIDAFTTWPWDIYWVKINRLNTC